MKFLSILIMTMHPRCCKFGKYHSVIFYIVDCTVNGNYLHGTCSYIYARMTISHSIVTVRVPWGVMNKWLIRSVPAADPSSLSEGADTMQTAHVYVRTACRHRYHTPCLRLHETNSATGDVVSFNTCTVHYSKSII